MVQNKADRGLPNKIPFVAAVLREVLERLAQAFSRALPFPPPCSPRG